MAIRSVQQARESARRDAVCRAKVYLERDAPNTLPAIEYLVNEEKWSLEKILKEFAEIYGVTEEKTQHKIRLVIEATIRERDE